MWSGIGDQKARRIKGSSKWEASPHRGEGIYYSTLEGCWWRRVCILSALRKGRIQESEKSICRGGVNFSHWINRLRCYYFYFNFSGFWRTTTWLLLISLMFIEFLKIENHIMSKLNSLVVRLWLTWWLYSIELDGLKLVIA